LSVPGYHGHSLRVDLTTGSSQRVAIEEATLRGSLGGSGLGVALLLNEGVAAAEPLSPAAALAFVFSPLVGSPLTTSAKFAVVSKSPLTNRINDSLASSGFALAGKKTGHDAILLTGRAAQPTVVIIDKDAVRFEPAGDLWGLTNRAAQQRLRERFGADFQAATIGPAGERLVRYATISHDGLARRSARGSRWQRGGARGEERQGGSRPRVAAM
jgi:aldehyde:ferredoxin oxidoreductase